MLSGAKEASKSNEANYFCQYTLVLFNEDGLLSSRGINHNLKYVDVEFEVSTNICRAGKAYDFYVEIIVTRRKEA